MFYTDSHEWIAADGNKGKAGISKHARNELGEIVYVELPKVGQVVKAGDEVSVLESTKAAADVYAPVSGKITAVNEALKQNLYAINQDPENSGWLFEIELSQPKELGRLMTSDEYRSLVGPI